MLFLDADDILAPAAIRRVVETWRSSCAKVQFRLSLINADGVRQGVDPPAHVPLPTGDVVPTVAAHGRYTTPVTSGNAFSRRVLEQLLPIPEDEFRNTDDGYLNPLCPFYGEVVSIDEELGAYQLHGRNLWAFSSGITLARLHDWVRHDLARQRHLLVTAARRGRPLPSDVMLRCTEHVLIRLGSLRWDPVTHPAPGDSRWRLLVAGLRAVARDPGLRPAEKAFTAAVLGAESVLPRPLARRVLTFAVSSRPRPRWVRALARLLRRAGRSI